MADGSYIDPTYDATDTVSKLNLTRERFERLRSIVEIKPGPPPIVSGFSVELELTHQDARDLIDALETAWHRIDDIERQNLNLIVERDALKDDMAWVKDYDPFSSRACPLCTYAYGLYRYPCNFHKEIATLKAKVEELEQARRLGMVWLCDR